MPVFPLVSMETPTPIEHLSDAPDGVQDRMAGRRAF